MIIGLTGGIGSGKTTVSKMFMDLKVPVYNSDEEAKYLMGSSPPIRTAIQNLLGEASYSGNTPNRTYISNIVFKDREKLQQLNEIVHPAVRDHFLHWAKSQSAPYIIQEAAIIFENGREAFYDKIILVTAPLELRIKRIMDRDGASEEDVRARMENQWPDSRKIPRSDFVIHNLEAAETRAKVRAIHFALLAYS